MPTIDQDRDTAAGLARAAPGRKPNILLVEDDQSIADEVRDDLISRGYVVEHIGDGAVALRAVQARHYDLLIVDRLLPGLDGLTVIERLRSLGVRTPVLVLSALSAVDDRVRGLKAGGDDYLTKPFAFMELAARVEALLRRPIDMRETVLRVGPLEMDLIDRTCKRGERELDLLPREFKLLEYLMRRPGQLVTRDMLLEDVWQYRFLPQTNLVDVHIGRLRRKLDAPGEAPLIHSVRGAGFIFRVPD
ncbi:MAG TPA: response regulator transcription factor [Acetobacteraceae bacterium]|nr:response regulator transcription factor [Acetobacteraceae bacterium]